MLRRNVASKTSSALGWLGTISGTLVVVVGALLKLNATEYKEWWPAFYSLLSFSQHSAWLTIPLLAIVTGLSQTLKTRIGSYVTWRTIENLLDEYRDALFEKRPAKDDPEHFHRVTVFRYVRWRWAFARWPWTGWMVPIARSGHTTRNRRIPRFRSPADDPDEAEGVAGQTWARDRMVPVYNLPDIHEATSDDEIEIYARRSFVSVKWIRKRQHEHHPKSLLGIPLEVKGEPWGALVVDSRSPDDISSKSALKGVRFEILTKVLSKLLQQ